MPSKLRCVNLQSRTGLKGDKTGFLFITFLRKSPEQFLDSSPLVVSFRVVSYELRVQPRCSLSETAMYF